MLDYAQCSSHHENGPTTVHKVGFDSVSHFAVFVLGVTKVCSIIRRAKNRFMRPAQ